MQICFGGTSSSEVNEFTSSSNLETRNEDYNQRGDHVFGAIIVGAYRFRVPYMKKSITVTA